MICRVYNVLKRTSSGNVILKSFLRGRDHTQRGSSVPELTLSKIEIDKQAGFVYNCIYAFIVTAKLAHI